MTIVIRCLQCGNTMQTWNQVNVRGYKEELSNKPCLVCRGKITSIEAKLLKAIFGGE